MFDLFRDHTRVPVTRAILSTPLFYTISQRCTIRSAKSIRQSIDLCAKDLTANLGFVRYADSFQKSGQHSLLVINTLASKGWTLAFTLPNAVHVMSFRVNPVAPSQKIERKLLLSSLHLNDPLSARGEPKVEEAPIRRSDSIRAQTSLSPPGSGKKIFP